MIPLLTVLRKLGAALREGWRRPDFRALATLVIVLIGSGTWFYRVAEDFSWTDSFYFTVVTLTTVGYGDLAPATTGGKLFTAFFVLIGVGVLVAFVAEIATAAARVQAEHSESRRKRRGGDPGASESAE